MDNINKSVYVRGCYLGTKICGNTSDTYQFVFNPDTAEFSDIYSYHNGLEFEIDDDGLYRIVTLQNNNAELTDSGLKIGSRTYDSQELLNAIESNLVNVGIYDINDTFCICKLKKCLSELEMKMFQEMLKNCGSSICKNEEIKSQRDFLFIAVWLIEHYIELENIPKAQAIYESIKGCGNLCGKLLNDKNDCGCNG